MLPIPLAPNRSEYQPLTQKTWYAILRRDPCAYCGNPSREVDHIVPRTAGGQPDAENETGACLKCNRAKKSHSLLAILSGQEVGLDAETQILRPRRQFVNGRFART